MIRAIYRTALLFSMILLFACGTPRNTGALGAPGDLLWTPDNGNPWFTVGQQTWTAAGEQADPDLITVNGTVYMFYRGRNAGTLTQVGVRYTAEENYPDGPWTEYSGNPVISVWDNITAINGPARTVQMPDNSFRLYTHANDAVTEDCYVFTTTANDFPGGWTNRTLIIQHGGGGYKSQRAALEAVITPGESPDGLWHFYFNGFDGTYWLPGHATSADGLTLTEDPGNPMAAFPLVPGTWRSGASYVYGYFKWSGIHYLIITGKDGLWQGGSGTWRTGISSSVDLLNWSTPTLIATEGPPGWVLYSPVIHYIRYDVAQNRFDGWGEGSHTASESGFSIVKYHFYPGKGLTGGTLFGGTIR